eukprot:TRINITY_DN251_c0_g1_i9.p1 TRINITY_DN251_c0_g1~~TRINITY_DN251_c0_g1_i9.p1  ORF type:complete len:372 (+),score=52.29 TRINITY_DN251_c0_g1_i9:2458-3573(+)
MGVAARLGIMFKSGDTLEKMARVNAVCFDKTGTLTQGKLTVVNYILLSPSTRKTTQPTGGDLDRDSLLGLVASAETGSEHPIARAIVGYASEEGIKISMPDQTVIVPGCGVLAKIGSSTVCVGNAAKLEECNTCPVSLSKSLRRKTRSAVQRMQENGESIVYVSVNGVFRAILSVADAIRSDASIVVAKLQRQNMQVWMVTGDHPTVAQVVADAVGIPISQVISGVKPTEKAEVIANLQSQGLRVAMIGDGINDSVALSQAHVGVAVGSLDLVHKVADVVLLQPEHLQSLLVAFDLSFTVLRRIRVNLAWSFAYNMIFIALAAGVWYVPWKVTIPPPLAGLSELLSSMPVILSSLLLNRYSPPAFSGSSTN